MHEHEHTIGEDLRDGFNALAQRFWSFDRLIGASLIKLMYYLGLAVIALALVLGVILGVQEVSKSVFKGLSHVLGAFIVSIAFVLLWRFLCEMAILLFHTYARLGEIRDRLPPPPAVTPTAKTPVAKATAAKR